MNEGTLQRGGVGPTRKGRLRSVVSLLALSLGVTSAVIASPPGATSALDALNPVSHLAKRHWFQIGRASWYGRGFQGHKTANGERFDMNELTCAHRTLPLGSWVRVTNLLNRKVAYVRVNDRGPVPQTRVIDLSYAAAQKLGIGGTAKVQIEQVKLDDPQLMASAMKVDYPPLLPEMPGLTSGSGVSVYAEK